VVRLPVSGLEAALRPPDGADELALREAPGSPVSRALTLLSRLSKQTDWGALTVTDFERLLLGLRAQVFGEAWDLGFACPRCAARVEVSFHIADYVGEIRPHRPPDVHDAPGRLGWYVSRGVTFRLPTAGDQAAVAGAADAERRLAERCIAPPLPAARARRGIERVMAAMAPEVSRPLAGACPACAAAVEAPLDVARLVVAELTRESASLHDEVDLIARAYHWPEADILGLPRGRRQAYAERIRRAA
jgi:hypothetical protein